MRTMTASSLLLLVFLNCKFFLPDEDKKKDKLVTSGIQLILAKNSGTASSSTYSTGLTIRIPDGVPLVNRVSRAEDPNWDFLIDLLKNTGMISKAIAAENEWAFVRQSALWANNNTDAIEAIIGPIKRYNLLNTVSTIKTDVQLTSGTVFVAKLTVNANTSVSSSAYTGTQTYKHKFELWRKSDNVKALEFFFDNVDQLDSKGVILLYNLNVLDPANYADSLVCETYAAKVNVSYLGATTSSQKQTISWSGTQSFYSGSKGGRVVVELMDNNTVLCFKSVVRFQNGANFNWCETNATPGDDKYYALAYSQFLNNADFEATAKLSILDNDIDTTGKFCQYATRNYGLFKKAGFIADTKTAGQVGAEYPSTSRVDTLFSKIGTSGSGEWDNMTKTKIDSLNIQFHDAVTPP